MDAETPFRRLTRGIEHVHKFNCGAPSFDLGVSQIDSGNASFIAELEEDKLRAETQRKRGNDYVKIRNRMIDCQSKDDSINVLKISMVSTSGSKKRKEKEMSNSSNDERAKCSKFYQSKAESNDVEIQHKDSIFVITDLPKNSPHVSCYVEMKIFDTLKQKLSSVQLREFMGTCFGQYANMPESWVQSQMFRCAMSLELKTSSTDAIMLRFNENTLRFSLRDFAIISGLNCVACKGDFIFNTSVPNRLMQTYFDGEEEPYKATLFQAFEDKV
ncbi:hypothetical protein FXO38_03997 [Capsicum annuum]|nr:hypothetical protein FXO38_03997 [Capsicum annuum]